jgi:FtsZ-binding cell division protein ZapB
VHQVHKESSASKKRNPLLNMEVYELKEEETALRRQVKKKVHNGRV